MRNGDKLSTDSPRNPLKHGDFLEFMTDKDVRIKTQDKNNI